MKKIFLAGAALAASLVIAGCDNNATTANKADGNTAVPTNAAAPAAPADANATGGDEGGEGGADATNQNFMFVNQTGETVTMLHVSPTGERSWEEDVLGRDVLPNGESVQVTFARSENRCFYDIRATAEDGTEHIGMNQNLCELTTVTALPAQ